MRKLVSIPSLLLTWLVIPGEYVTRINGFSFPYALMVPRSVRLNFSVGRVPIPTNHHPSGSPPFRRVTTHRHLLEQKQSIEETTSDNNNNNSVQNDDAKLQQVELPDLSSLSIRTWFKDTIFLGIDPTPDVVAIATIYFVEGALGLARLAQTYLLKDELHLGPAELSALTGFFVLPWSIKPVYGFLSDGLPLFGYRRRSYLILAGGLGFFSYFALGQNFFGLLPLDQIIPATVVALLVSSACIAFSDVVADGIVVQKTRDSDNPAIAGGLQSLCWGSAAIGGLLSAYFSGSLLEVMKPQDVFGITAVLPLLVAAIAFLIDEQPVLRKGRQGNNNNNNNNNNNSLASTTSTDAAAHGLVVVEDEPKPFDGIQDQIDALWGAIKQPSIYKPALFLFLWQSTPTSDGAFFFFMTDELGFGPEFLGRVRLISAGASLFGVWLYNQYLKTKPIKDILFWASIISVPLGLSSLLLITHANRALGIPDGMFVVGDDVVLAVLGQIAFLPTLVLAARLCPPGVEAVLFATLMSINNGASTLGTEIGALLTKALGVTATNYDNLALLTIICNLTSLYPLFFIGWLDEVGSQSEEEIEQQLER
jgi:folate/biopterin transporter